MVTIGEFYSNVKSILNNAEIESYSFEAKCIFEKAFRTNLPSILTNRTSVVPDEVFKSIESMTQKRITGYPLQYILGEWEFFGYTFKIGEGVLIPRQDTETIIEHILEKRRINTLKSPKIIDLCSGSGCIAVTLKKELPEAEIFALEKSENAFKYLEENIKLNDVDVRTVKSDVLLEESTDGLNDFDIIVSNPPYLTRQDMKELQKEVRFEPSSALYAGEDGLHFYREITKIWKNSLKTNGILVYEIGMGQHDDIADILKSEGFESIEYIKDTADIIRVVSAVKQEV